MKRAPESLRVIVFDTTPAKADATTQRLTELGHLVIARTSVGPLFARAVRDESAELIALGLDGPEHDGLDVVRSILETEPLPALVLVDAFGPVPEELHAHPSAAVVRRGASDAEWRIRIAEARAGSRRERAHAHRVERLKARLAHEPQIARAKARLMEQHGVDEEEAYGMLRTASQDRRMKLEDLAHLVLAEGVHVVADRTPAHAPRMVRR